MNNSGSPNQNSSMMFNIPQQGQMGFNNRGGAFYPMQGNMMQNMGSNMTPMNYDWMQSGMGGGGMNAGMGANMGNYNNQMFPPMNPNMNNNDFMNVMMNNMYRNQGQPQNMMNPMQQMNNPNQMMGQQGGFKIDDVLSNNMNTLNQFYSYINSQNRNLMSSMNMPYDSNPYNQMGSQKNFDYQNDSMQLPNKTEFMQPTSFQAYGAYPNDMSSMQNVGSKPYLNTSTTENVPTDYSTVQENKAEERNKSRPGPNRAASKVINDNPEEVPIKNKNPEEEPVGTKKAAFDWEDRPIKPAKNGFDWEEQPTNASKGNEDRPIKSKAPPKKKPQPKLKEEVEVEEAEDDYYQSRSNLPEYKNPYDEVQIGGQSGKRFEDLLEEQLRANPDAVSKPSKKKAPNPNRQFLKKGARTHLSSAALRDPKILDESSQKQDADSHNDSGVMTFSSAPTKPPSKGPKGLQNKQQRKSLKGESEGSFPGGGNAAAPEKVSEKPKEPKKFLTRGGGTGGGIGNTTTAAPATATANQTDRARKSIKEDPQDRHEEERSKSSHARNRADTKKSEDYNEKPAKANKTQGKFGGGKPELSNNHEDSYNDAQSFEKEYGFEKYTKKSPRAQGKNLSAKRKESPKYNFDDDSASNKEEEENAPQVDNYGDEAPVSNLVNKYFYKKKPVTGKEKEEKEEEEPEKNEEEDNMQKLANDKIETLNSEIARFKLENERVKKIRQKHDEMLKALNKDMSDWSKQKEKEQREFEEWKQEEMRKVKNEKKLAERHQKTVSNMPSRKEREEIDNLKKQIAKLAEELQTKDKRSKLNMDRLKRQIEEAEQRNSELLDELRTLGKVNPKFATQGAKNKPSHAFEDEEEQYDDHENNGELDDQDHEDEDMGRDKEASDEENGSDNENLNYEDIVNQPGAKNTGLSRGNYDAGSHSPKFDNEKNMNLTTLSKPGQNETAKSKGGHHHRTSSTKMGGIDEDHRPSANLQNQNRFASQDYRYDSNASFKKYIANRNEVSKIVNQTVAGDGKIQRIYADGKKEVIFHNGVKREIFPDGYTIVHFINNDIKQTLPDNTVIYFFADAQTTQTTLPNGRHVYRFANNQVELHNPDGSKDIYFADQTRKTIFPNGDEETVFTDGTVQRVNAQKIKTITYASGQKDVVYPDGTKVRTYPDGRVRKHYPDGTTEDF